MSQTSKTPLDISKVQEPFDLATALTYMTQYGEFIRCIKGDLDFYFYQFTENRPILVEGCRQWVTVNSIQTSTQWHSSVPHFDMALLNESCFYLMGFKENGDPNWEHPQTSLEGDSQ